jgi:hypothetical protein
MDFKSLFASVLSQAQHTEACLEQKLQAFAKARILDVRF